MTWQEFHHNGDSCSDRGIGRYPSYGRVQYARIEATEYDLKAKIWKVGRAIQVMIGSRKITLTLLVLTRKCTANPCPNPKSQVDLRFIIIISARFIITLFITSTIVVITRRKGGGRAGRVSGRDGRVATVIQ